MNLFKKAAAGSRDGFFYACAARRTLLQAVPVL